MAAQPPRRRATDSVPPDVKLYVNDEIASTRHVLRGEFAEALALVGVQVAEVGRKVEVGNLVDVEERARITAALEALNGATKGLRAEVADLRAEHGSFKRDVEQRLRKVEDADTAQGAVGEMREILARDRRSHIRWLVGTVIALGMLIVAAAAFLAQHVH